MSKYDTNGWDEYQKLVLSELERLSEGQEAINKSLKDFELSQTERITKLEVELKTKAGVWGLFGGLLTAFLSIAIAVAVALL